MSAGVSPISPAAGSSPASRTQYEATPISPSVMRAINNGVDPRPSPNAPQDMAPSPPNDGTGATFSMMV